MVNVIFSPHQTKQLVCFVLPQHPNSGANAAESVHLFPSLTERISRAVLVVSIVQGIEEGLVHYCRSQQTCLLPGFRDVTSNKTLK